jgi:membrane protease YdiL (CAAX protease family)
MLTKYSLLLSLLVAGPQLYAKDQDTKIESQRGKSWFTPPSDPDEPRSDIWVPAVSFILPGFGQFLNGEYTSGSVYAGLALGGYAYANRVRSADDIEHARQLAEQRAKVYGDKDPPSILDQKGVGVRKYTLGQLVAQGSGGFSAYQSFRMAATTRRQQGEYEFLTRDETPMDIFGSIFHFQYLSRPSTLIPLAIGAGLAYLRVNSALPDNMVRDNYTSADAFFTASFSANAGTHEEAVFRGWIMPMLREQTGSDLWSNVLQGAVFAAAHLSTNATPLPQLLLGLDLGYISQRNGWTLGESVFIHTWWDVFAFWAQYQTTWKYAKSPLAAKALPVLWLPPLEWAF